jgi:curved DNA-binding protein CbpA
MGQTHYQILGVDNSATPEDLKKAYKAAAKASHPDHHPDDPTAEERFKAVAAAWDVLGDAEKRKAYDELLARPPEPEPLPPPPPPPPRQRQPWEDVQPAPRSTAADPGVCPACLIAQRSGRLRCADCDQAHHAYVHGVHQASAGARRRYAPLAPRMRPLESYWRRQVVLEDAFGHLGAWGRDGLPRW